MVVAMPQTEDRNPLKVEPEITVVNAAFPQTVISWNPTEKETFDHMQACNIGHFICHGCSDPKNLSKSSLVLSAMLTQQR
jgi:hypothetical protein